MIAAHGRRHNPAKVCLNIVRAANLPTKDTHVSSDPCCVVKLRGGMRDYEFKTNVIQNELNPQWEEEFILSDKISSPFGCTVEFQVKSRDVVLGGVICILVIREFAHSERKVPLLSSDDSKGPVANGAALLLKLTNAVLLVSKHPRCPVRPTRPERQRRLHFSGRNRLVLQENSTQQEKAEMVCFIREKYGTDQEVREHAGADALRVRTRRRASPQV